MLSISVGGCNRRTLGELLHFWSSGLFILRVLGVTVTKSIFATGAARYAPTRSATMESCQTLPLSIERVCFGGDDPIFFKLVQPTGGDMEKFCNLLTYLGWLQKVKEV